MTKIVIKSEFVMDEIEPKRKVVIKFLFLEKPESTRLKAKLRERIIERTFSLLIFLFERRLSKYVPVSMLNGIAVSKGGRFRAEPSKAPVNETWERVSEISEYFRRSRKQPISGQIIPRRDPPISAFCIKEYERNSSMLVRVMIVFFDRVCGRAVVEELLVDKCKSCSFFCYIVDVMRN